MRTQGTLVSFVVIVIAPSDDALSPPVVTAHPYWVIASDAMHEVIASDVAGVCESLKRDRVEVHVRMLTA